MIDIMSDWLIITIIVLLLSAPIQMYRMSRRKPPEGSTHVSGTTMEYWVKRSTQYGRRAVLNLRYGDKDIENVTKQQIQEIFPHIKRSLQGWEKTVLDFGSGPGRFSKALADLTGGRTIAVDPIDKFISLAPKADNVEYFVLQAGRIPAPDLSIDLLWVCLVLGGIRDESLKETMQELKRVLKPGALICLVENTASRANSAYWTYRSADDYRKLFDFASLERVHSYDELGENISVFIGRKAF